MGLSKNDDPSVPILKTTVLRGFQGFLLNIRTFRSMYNEFVTSNRLHVLLTYKFSQDHLEMFFGAIRSKGGWNNNPSAYQFNTAYKRLLIQSDFKASKSANCTALDSTGILDVSSSSKTAKPATDSYQEINIDAEQSDPEPNVVEDLPTDKYTEDTVAFIAGNIQKGLCNKIKCQCPTIFFKNFNLCPNADQTLRSYNTFATIHADIPCKEVYSICMTCEAKFSSLIHNEQYEPNQQIFIALILRDIPPDLFANNEEFSDHIKNQSATQNH